MRIIFISLYNYLGLGLLGLFVFMVIPFDTQAESNESMFYGAADIVVYDEFGNEMLTQTVHNRLVNQGEDFILEMSFTDGLHPTGSSSGDDSVAMNSICLTSFDVSGVGETYTAAQFDVDNALDNTATPCLRDSSADRTVQGKRTIGPLVFQVPQNAPLTGDIKGIGICRSNSGSFIGCDDYTSGGVFLFAVVDTTDILNLQQDQTVSVKYTFDITSDDT
jgi:hypothetical protein